MYFVILNKSIDIISFGACLLTFFAAAVGIFAVLTVPQTAKKREKNAANAELTVQSVQGAAQTPGFSETAWQKNVLFFALVCYALFLAALVFLPIGDASGAPSGMNSGGFSWEISYAKLFSHPIFVLNSVINFLLFFVLGALFAVQTRGRLRLLKTVAVCAAASVAIELLQLFVPTRASDACDILINVSGAFFGALAGLAFQRQMKIN